MHTQFSEATAEAIARAIAGVQRDAARAEQLRDAEHRAFMAEQREGLAALTRKLEDRIASVRDGIDGSDGAPGADGRDGAPGERGTDGRDGVDGSAGADGQDGSPGADGRDGLDGAPGERGADGRDGIDGALGTDGRDGTDGAPGRDGKDAAAGRDGVGLTGAAIDREGCLILTLSDGTLHRLGIILGRDGVDGAPGRDGVDGANGRDGADGAPGRDGTDGKRGEPGTPGNDGRDGADAYAGEARGLFDEAATYRAMDVVSFNGSEWRAKRNDPGELPGDGWMLSASRGKRGDRGERGQQGAEGKAAPRPVARYFDARSGELVDTYSDGSELKVDLSDLAHTAGAE